MDIYERANQQRERVLANDKATRDALIKAYAVADKNLQARLSALLDLIERRREAGEEVSRAWLQKETRYNALLDQVHERTKELAQFTATETTKAVRANLTSGTHDALALIDAAQGNATVAGAFDRLNARATENIAAYLDTNAPLGRLLARIVDEMPADAVKAAKDVLLIGVSAGQGPRVVARNLRDVTGASLTRSLTISRTESLRAYRQASLQTYAESDVITGYQWLCTKSSRTCVACLAQDGRVYEKSAQFPAHVRCRCTTIPFVGQPRARETGEEWLKAQDADTQDKVMGPAAAAAWRAGEVRLRDFVGVRQNVEYGASVYHDSLKGARERAAKRAKKGTIKVGNDGNNGAKDAGAGVNASDRIFTDAERAAMTPQVHAELSAIEPLVSNLVGLPSNWSKRVEVTDKSNEKGSKPFGCDIRITDTTLQGENKWYTLIHEMLHAHSTGYTATAFSESIGWEEAVIEQTQRLIRERVLSALPDAMRPAVIPPVGNGVDRRHKYNIYIVAMEQIRALTGEEQDAFYFRLLKTPLGSRKAVTTAQIMRLPAEQRRAALLASGKPYSVLGRDLNKESMSQAAIKSDALDVEARKAGDVLYGKE